MLYRLRQDGGSTIFVPLTPTSMAQQGLAEKAMEQWLADYPAAVFADEEHLLVVDQEKAFQNITDILAVDADGNAVIIEIKRGQTPRDVIAQALEYASDVETWSYAQLNQRALRYFSERRIQYDSLMHAYQDAFAVAEGEFSEQQFNQRQRIIIVGETIDTKIERTSRWLLRRGIEIRCLSYQCYQSAEGDFLLNFTEVVRPEEVVGLKTPTGSDAAIRSVPDEQQYVDRMSAPVQEIYRELRQRLLSFGPDVQQGTTGNYIKFLAGRNFAEIHARRGKLWCYARPAGLQLEPGESTVVDGLPVKRVASTVTWALNHMFEIQSTADLDPAERVFRMSYEDVTRSG